MAAISSNLGMLIAFRGVTRSLATIIVVKDVLFLRFHYSIFLAISYSGPFSEQHYPGLELEVLATLWL